MCGNNLLTYEGNRLLSITRAKPDILEKKKEGKKNLGETEFYFQMSAASKEADCVRMCLSSLMGSSEEATLVICGFFRKA